MSRVHVLPSNWPSPAVQHEVDPVRDPRYGVQWLRGDEKGQTKKEQGPASESWWQEKGSAYGCHGGCEPEAHAAQRNPACRRQCHAGAWPGCATHMWRRPSVATTGSRDDNYPACALTWHGSSGIRHIRGPESPTGLRAVHAGSVGGDMVTALKSLLSCSEPEANLHSG